MSTQPVPTPAPEPAPTPGGPGWKTSEFWVTLGTLGALLGASFSGHDPGTAVTAGATAASSIYALVRAFTKRAG